MTGWTVGGLAEAIKAKKLSPIEVVREYFSGTPTRSPRGGSSSAAI